VKNYLHVSLTVRTGNFVV